MSQQMIHASTVALNGQAVVIMGASGTGKSTLALELIGQGATLIADDQTILTRVGDDVIASCPDAIKGQIEVRHMGLLRCDAVSDVPVGLVIDLDQTETQRLPAHRTIDLAGIDLPLLYRIKGPHFAVAIGMFMKFGRIAT